MCKDSVKTLIVGNSHAEDGIDPSLFSSYTYNLAFSSQSLLHDDLLIRKYLPLLPNLKKVVLSIDYHSLYMDESEDREFLYSYYFDIRLHHQKKLFLKENLSFLFFVYTPTILTDLLNGKSNIPLVKGWNGVYSKSSADVCQKRGELRVDYFRKMIREKLSSKKNKEVYYKLNRLIQFLQSNEIQVVLISTPCHSIFNNLLDSKIIRQNLTLIQELTNCYKIPYINSMKDTKYKTNDFYNVDHLNTRGARKYSKFLNDTLIKLTMNSFKCDLITNK